MTEDQRKRMERTIERRYEAEAKSGMMSMKKAQVRRVQALDALEELAKYIKSAEELESRPEGQKGRVQ